MSFSERKASILEGSRVSHGVNEWLTRVNKISLEAGVAGYLKGGVLRDFVYNYHHRTNFKPGDLDIMFTGGVNFVMGKLVEEGANLRIRRNRKKTPVFELDLPTTDGEVPLDIGILLAKPEVYERETPAATFVEEDARLSDFTVNSLFLPLGKDLNIDNIIDPLGGIQDIKEKVIRMVVPNVFIRNPESMLRAVVLVDHLKASLDERTATSVVKHAKRIRNAPNYVVNQNMRKINSSDNWKANYELISDLGLMKHIPQKFIKHG